MGRDRRDRDRRRDRSESTDRGNGSRKHERSSSSDGRDDKRRRVETTYSSSSSSSTAYQLLLPAALAAANAAPRSTDADFAVSMLRINSGRDTRTTVLLHGLPDDLTQVRTGAPLQVAQRIVVFTSLRFSPSCCF